MRQVNLPPLLIASALFLEPLSPANTPEYGVMSSSRKSGDLGTIPIWVSCVILRKFLGALKVCFVDEESSKQKLVEGEADNPPKFFSLYFS